MYWKSVGWGHLSVIHIIYMGTRISSPLPINFLCWAEHRKYKLSITCCQFVMVAKVCPLPPPFSGWSVFSGEPRQSISSTGHWALKMQQTFRRRHVLCTCQSSARQRRAFSSRVGRIVQVVTQLQVPHNSCAHPRLTLLSLWIILLSAVAFYYCT